jgi:hypothetical protein
VNAFTGQGLSPAQRDMQEYMRKLLLWRRGAPALHHGKLTQFVPLAGIYVYFRHTDTQKVMVILNNTEEAKTVDAKRFHEVIGSATTGTDVITKQPHRLDQGITAPAHSATILELD